MSEVGYQGKKPAIAGFFVCDSTFYSTPLYK
jgi:hypothetical protein